MADYEQHLQELESQGARIVAISSDPEAEAARTRQDLSLSFPVGYGVDAAEFAAATGAYWKADDEEPYLHVAGFVIDAQGVVDTAIYSSGSGGRLTVAEALRFTKG